METALSTISALPNGKAEVERFKAKLKNEILSGEKDVLKILTHCKHIEKTIKETLADEEIENCFLNALEKYGKEKNIEINGMKLNAQETGVKYAYNLCNDPEWNDLNKKITEMDEKRKAREKFLQTIPLGGVADPETGVIINRPPKSSTTKVVCKFI